jgi:hypothetical protein
MRVNSLVLSVSNLAEACLTMRVPDLKPLSITGSFKRSVFSKMQLKKQRHAMADPVIKRVEGFQHDYMRDVKLVDVFELLLIIHRMLHAHEAGHEATATAIGRGAGMSRATVQRKPKQLKRMGLIEQHGRRHSLSAECAMTDLDMGHPL